MPVTGTVVEGSAPVVVGGTSTAHAVVEALASHYARTGYVTGGRHSRGNLAAALDRHDIDDALDTLQKVEAVTVGQHAVVLAPPMKIELMRLPILRVWAHSISTTHEPAQRQDLVDGAREELELLVTWARVQMPLLTPVAREYTACLAGVLAVPGLQPEAFTAVHWHFGTPEDKLAFLTSRSAERVADPMQLVHRMRRSVHQDLTLANRYGRTGSAGSATLEEDAAARRLIGQLRSGAPVPPRPAADAPVVLGRVGGATPRGPRHSCGPACRASH